MNLKNHFLIATPTIEESLFSHSVVYICEHNADGAMGVIINKPIELLTLNEVLDRLNIYPSQPLDYIISDKTIFNGGPLAQEQGFILHSPQEGFSSSLYLSDEIMITTSPDILKAIGTSKQPKHIFIALGYSNWGKGQLENEIVQNNWIITEAEANIIFNTPISARWSLAAKKLGINIATVSTQYVRMQ